MCESTTTTTTTPGLYAREQNTCLVLRTRHDASDGWVEERPMQFHRKTRSTFFHATRDFKHGKRRRPSTYCWALFFWGMHARKKYGVAYMPCAVLLRSCCSLVVDWRVKFIIVSGCRETTIKENIFVCDESKARFHGGGEGEGGWGAVPRHFFAASTD